MILPPNPQIVEDSLSIDEMAMEISRMGLTVEQMQKILRFARRLHRQERKTCHQFHYSVSFSDSQSVDAAIESGDPDAADRHATLITSHPVTCEEVEELLLAELRASNPAIETVNVSDLTRIVSSSPAH
jgi:hypothetical protein